MTQRSFEALVDYLNSPPTTVQPNQSDVAKFILGSKVPETNVPVSARNKQPSLMGRIFDALSVGNYAMAGFVKDWQESGSPSLSGFGQGIEDKTTFSDVLEEGGMTGDARVAGLGFMLDVAADPLTWIPGGAIAKGVSKLRPAKEIAETPQISQQILRADEAISPESFQARGIELPDQVGRFTPSTAQDLPVALRPEQRQQVSLADPDVPVPGAATAPIKFGEDVTPPMQGYQPALPGIDEGIPATKAEKRSKQPSAIEALSDIVQPTKKAETPGLKRPPGQMTFSNLADAYNVKGVAKMEPQAAKDLRKGGKEFKHKLQEQANLLDEAVAGSTEAVAKVAPTPKAQWLDKIDNTRHVKPAQKVYDNFDFSAGSKSEKLSKIPGSVNAAQQTKLYHNVRQQVHKRFHTASKGTKAADTFKALVQLENIAEAAGKSFYIDDVPMKLSDVIAKAGGPSVAEEVVGSIVKGQTKSGSIAEEAVNALKVGNAIEDAPKAQTIVHNIKESQQATEASNMLSDAQMGKFEDFLKKFSEASAKAQGLGPNAEDATKRMVKNALASNKTAAELATESKGRIALDIINSGKNSPEYVKAVHKALEKDIGKIPEWAVHQIKAVESIMGKVATHFGQKELRPLTLNMIASAQTTATKRGDALAKLFRDLDDDQSLEVIKVAQELQAPSSEATREVATQVKRMFDNLFARAKGDSVAARSAVTMDNLNKWMDHFKAPGRFSENAKDITGQPVPHWLDSWKTWDITEDAKGSIFRIQQAMEMAARERAVFDDLGVRFGSITKTKEFNTKVSGHEYLNGWYFPSDIAQQIPRFVRDWSPNNLSTQATSPLLRHYDRVLSMWKSGVTIYRPGHHLRNMAGDVWLGWMDGVNSVRPYKKAMQVQKYLKGYENTLADIDHLVELGLAPRGMETPIPGKTFLTNKSGTKFTVEEVAAVAEQRGLLEHVQTLEDLIDMGENTTGILGKKPFGGRVQKFARTVSETQSHNARLAHAIDKIMKSRGGNKDQIFEEAIKRARKWHPTGLDLTKEEKTVGRRIMPFYSWMRKSTPLLLQGAVMNPGKVAVLPKGVEAIQEWQGIEGIDRSDPFPVDQMFPSWIREHGLGPIGKPEGMLGSIAENMPPGYVMGGVGLNPLTDLMTQIEDPGRTALSSLTPAVKVPTEVAAGQEFFTGQPITGERARPGAFQEYVGEQIPIWSAAQGIHGMTPFGTETRRGASTQNLINFLTAAGIRGTGPYQKSAKYEVLAPLETQEREARQQFYRDLFGG